MAGSARDHTSHFTTSSRSACNRAGRGKLTCVRMAMAVSSMGINLCSASHVRRLHERGPAHLGRRAIKEVGVRLPHFHQPRPLEVLRLQEKGGNETLEFYLKGQPAPRPRIGVRGSPGPGTPWPRCLAKVRRQHPTPPPCRAAQAQSCGDAALRASACGFNLTLFEPGGQSGSAHARSN